jgi:hypothetical protein
LRRFDGAVLMETPALVIGGAPAPFAAAWVHLKQRPHKPVGYEVRVPRSLWALVLDPTGRRPESLSWREYLWSDVCELGTFIMEGWFRALAKATLSGPPRWKWVIATIEELSQDGDFIRLSGKAERFEPRRFA